MSTISVDTITDEAGTGAPNFPNGVTGVSDFKPVAVTGTTLSLDVGTYNYFNSGTLTADTTLSFASVPTTARWSYSFIPSAIPAAWDITYPNLKARLFVEDDTTVGYTGVDGLKDIFIKPNGLKMYLVSDVLDTILEYDLSTAWDITTASYLQSFSIAAQETTPKSVFFKPDGTKMYVAGSTSDSIHEYDLSTAWDVSTSVFLQSFSINAQEAAPSGLFIKPDGLELYIAGTSGDGVDQYTLSTAWNISTMTHTRHRSLATEDTAPVGLFFKEDGLKMFMYGLIDDAINMYTLSTAWDISTTTFTGSTNLRVLDTNINGIFFKPGGETMYLTSVDFGGNGTYLRRESLLQFELGPMTALTFPASVEGTQIPSALGTRATYEFATLDGGTTVIKTGYSETELVFRNLDPMRY